MARGLVSRNWRGYAVSISHRRFAWPDGTAGAGEKAMTASSVCLSRPLTGQLTWTGTKTKAAGSRTRDRTQDKGLTQSVAAIRSGVLEVVQPLQDAIAVLEAQLTEANTRATRAESEVSSERVRTDILRDRLEATEARARDAEQAARIATDALKALRQAGEGGQEGEGAPASRLGRLAGAIGMAAAADLRRAVRLASWRPRAVLRRLWSRLRATWRER
jgi:hypothetical protein